MALMDASDALTQIIIFTGVILGNMGATLLPYLKAQAKYGEFDIKILFQSKFIGTMAASAITAFVLVSGSFTSFLGQVLAGNPVTVVAAFLAALGLGFTINTGANWLLPSPANKEEEKLYQEKKAMKLLQEKGIDVERLGKLMTHISPSLSNEEDKRIRGGEGESDKDLG